MHLQDGDQSTNPPFAKSQLAIDPSIDRPSFIKVSLTLDLLVYDADGKKLDKKTSPKMVG